MSRFKKFVLYTSLTLGLASLAHAATTFQLEKPSNEMTIAQAAKAHKPFIRCRKVTLGPSGNPVAVKGAKPSWHTSVGKGIENAAELIADGKKPYKCDAVEIDNESARVKTAVLETE